MENVNLLNATPSTMARFLKDLRGKLALLTGLIEAPQGITLADIRMPMLVLGQPGVGKTMGIISVIEEFNERLKDKGIHLGFKKILLGQTVVGSLSGIPVVMPDSSVQRIQMPDLPDLEKDGEYGVLFLDEITTADEAQVQPALGLCDNSRNIGEYTLPEHWLVIGAGNGPDCSNFLRLDDMTINRFVTYDIKYQFQSDWRPYAQAHGIDERIIAFLNFKPDMCIHMESTDMDDNGKLFSSPRAWERLSVELKMREALGEKVSDDRMGSFAGRIIGMNAATEFQSFCICTSQSDLNPENILDGIEEDPDEETKIEVMFSLLQRCCTLLKNLIRNNPRDVELERFPQVVYEKTSNVLRWFMSLENISLETSVSCIFQLKNDDPEIASVLVDDELIEFCPEFDEFLQRHFSLMFETQDTYNMAV